MAPLSPLLSRAVQSDSGPRRNSQGRQWLSGPKCFFPGGYRESKQFHGFYLPMPSSSQSTVAGRRIASWWSRPKPDTIRRLTLVVRIFPTNIRFFSDRTQTFPIHVPRSLNFSQKTTPECGLNSWKQDRHGTVHMYFYVLAHEIQNTLHCTAPHCTALHRTVQHCPVQHCTALYCTALSYTVLHQSIILALKRPERFPWHGKGRELFRKSPSRDVTYDSIISVQGTHDRRAEMMEKGGGTRNPDMLYSRSTQEAHSSYLFLPTNTGTSDSSHAPQKLTKQTRCISLLRYFYYLFYKDRSSRRKFIWICV